ncbi:MAG: hypothetical protein D6705_08705, partial [Deltaproteobacteria bacterium]
REMAEGALRAGVDVLLACRSRELQEVLLGRLERLPDAVVERAVERVVTMKRTFAAAARDALLGGRTAGPPYPDHLALAERLGGGGDAGADPTEAADRR